MNPCLNRCYDCIFSEENQKKLKCLQGHFDVKLNDGILLVPMDFECLSFQREKDNKDEKR